MNLRKRVSILHSLLPLLMSHSSMSYKPQAETTARPVQERGPVLVTPLARLGRDPANVDCPYCKKVVKTQVHEVEADGERQVPNLPVQIDNQLTAIQHDQMSHLPGLLADPLLL
jgi:hypothetical protein